MSVIADVLQKLRGKRQEQVKTVWAQYHAMVRDLASDKQVDIDALAIVMDSLDKSDIDLFGEDGDGGDVKQQRDRTDLAAQHTELLRLRSELPKLASVHERAKEEYNEAVAKLGPKVSAAFDAWNAANHKILGLSSAESRLLETCQDPQLLDQQREIHAKRQELLNELRAMDDRNPHNEPRKTELKNQLSDLERQAAEVRTKMLIP